MAQFGERILNPENFSEFDLSLISPDKNGDSIFLPSKDMLKNISAADRRRSPTEQCIKMILRAI